MCGIVGLFIKNDTLKPQLGTLLTDMLITMTDRGPDSAGIAVYRNSPPDMGKITVQSNSPESEFDELKTKLPVLFDYTVSIVLKDSHAVLSLPKDKSEEIRNTLKSVFPKLRIMSSGETIEIYKEVGLAKDVTKRFSINKVSGSHGIGHTRMATESAVTTMGAHPFSTGNDQCLVHNGSLSNHNSLRRQLQREGMRIETLNDSEVAAAYLTYKLNSGYDLKSAMEQSLEDLDGFFTFVIGTKNGFGVVRDPIACKPAVMAETSQFVAFGSEYKALATLPDIDNAKIWEPEPATVYFWEH